MVSKLLIKDKMLIPKGMMSKKAVESRYNIRIFDEKMCSKCDNLPDRPNAMCYGGCPGLIADYKLWKETEKFWSVPQGDALGLQRILDKKGISYEVKDKRKSCPFSTDIKWTGKLFGEGHVDENGIPRANQKRAVKKWLKYKSGILRAPPRSGKTPMGTYLACDLGQRTVIFAHQHELLKQFYETIYKFTNVKELERQHRRKLVLYVRTPAQLKQAHKYDFVLVGYQKLIYSPDRIAKYLEGFGTAIVDEAHNSGAVNYLRIMSYMNVLYRLGLTATPRRKDNRHKLIERILGPVVSETESTSLIPRIEFYQSKAVPTRNYQRWPHAKRWLDLDKTRNLEIIHQVFKDINAGHEVIIIPVDTRNHQRLLVEAINRMGKVLTQKGKGDYRKDLAIEFNGEGGVKSKAREDVLKRVDGPGPTVMVAIRKMVREGLNMLRPSMMYIVEPMSASGDKKTGAPMFYQLSMRVCTPYKKPQPVVRIWVDSGVGMFVSCVKGLFYNEILPNAYDGKNGRYLVPPMYKEMFRNLHRNAPMRNASRVSNPRGWS